MLMFREEYGSRDDAFNGAIEKVFEMIEGAYEWDLDAADNIYPLERREISLTNEKSENVGRVTIDIYPSEEDGYYIVEAYLISGNISPITAVYTAREAEKIWGLGQNTVVKWIERGKFKLSEARKSGGTWLVTHKGMERVAGRLDDSWMTEIVENYVDGLKTFIDEADMFYACDYIDEIEDILDEKEIEYTDMEKEKIKRLIIRELVEEYGEDNVFYGSYEHKIVINDRVETIYAQLVIIK
ncbi:hypothetical protein BO219_06390 [Anoxybacillus kestanbolensis]|uniref:Helix-turn-helix domain-containing protein n=1 Tax=Anoxybacillus kestanbolensis TaxID=227476 RepID=A0A1V3FTS1_9BACL|nr:helix-turn-helix domain-containing protein [Anoxybacillus kestanbolensis]OOE05011.1 hypothetical protein BO219_06390 [Anoxybacillus kestanbolensis]